MFITAPDITPAIAKTARPCALNKLLKTKLKQAKGVPKKMILEYDSAYGKIVGVEPECLKIKPLKRIPNNPNKMLIISVNLTLDEAIIEALK